MKETVRCRLWCSSWLSPWPAGPKTRGPGAGRRAGYDRMYDPKTVETISGEVVSVDKIADQGMGYGASLTLKTAKETILVYLVPVGSSKPKASPLRPRIRWRSPAPKSPFKGDRLFSPRR